MSEKPVHPRPRRLVDWINPAGAKKVHSLIDKVYKRKNLEMAWERVNANRGSGGIDGQTLKDFAEQLDQNLDRLHSELGRMSINHTRCGRCRSQRRESRGSIAGSAFRRSMTGMPASATQSAAADLRRVGKSSEEGELMIRQ